MEVKELQIKIKKLIADWDKLKKKKYTFELAFIHLVEELGELARELINKKRRPSRYSKKRLIDAIGDILIFAILLASFKKVDVENLILNIINQDRKRMLKLKNKN